MNSRPFEQFYKDMIIINFYHSKFVGCHEEKLRFVFSKWRDKITILPQSFESFSLVKLSCISDIFPHLNLFSLNLQWEKGTIFPSWRQDQSNELWHHRLSNWSYETFPDLTNFLGPTNREFWGEQLSCCMTFEKYAEMRLSS